MANRTWYRFDAYNQETLYGYGTQAEAGEMRDYLNRGREIGLYAEAVCPDDQQDELNDEPWRGCDLAEELDAILDAHDAYAVAPE